MSLINGYSKYNIAGLIAERINIFLMIYTTFVSSTIPPPLAVIGPTFITFSAVFISLYWTALTFPKMEKAKRKQVFLPVLAFFVVRFYARLRFDLSLVPAGSAYLVHYKFGNYGSQAFGIRSSTCFHCHHFRTLQLNDITTGKI